MGREALREVDTVARAMWKGAIQFGLVTIPIKLYLATESKGISFNMLHKDDLSRIQMKIFCPVEDEVISRGDTVTFDFAGSTVPHNAASSNEVASDPAWAGWDTPFVVTGQDAYVRLRRTHYDDAALQAWVEKIAAQTCRRTYVYFMHEDEALGAVFAKRLLELWRARGA